MEQFLATAFAFPTLVFTVGVLFSLCYWMLVMFGALDLDFGVEGDVGDLDVGGDLGDVGDVGGDIDAGGDVGDAADGIGAEGASSLSSILSLRKAPLTVSLSLLFFFGWMICYGLSRYAGLVPGPELLGNLAVFGASTAIAWPIASIISAPIGRLFASNPAPSKRVLVGKVARIKIHADAGGHGQATLDNGSGSLLRVRCSDAPLTKNAKVLLLDYDAEADVYDVEPMDSLLEAEN